MGGVPTRGRTLTIEERLSREVRAPWQDRADRIDGRGGHGSSHCQFRSGGDDVFDQDELWEALGAQVRAWALAWCLRQQPVTAVIPGCKSVAQLDSNAAAAELDLAS